MIAPLRPQPRSTSPLRERSGLRKARRWIVRSLLQSPQSSSAPVSPRTAWLLALWMLFTAVAYFWHILGGYWERG